MKKEPLSLSICRLVLGLALLGVMCFLYDSSLSVKKNMKGVKGELSAIEAHLQELSGEIAIGVSVEERIVASNARPHIREDLPNMLVEDPFFVVTLPQMLGKGFKPHETLQSAMLGKPPSLSPFFIWRTVAEWHRQCTVSIAKQKFGIHETLCPDMAIKMEERLNEKTGKPEFWIHLRDGVYWEPLNPAFFPKEIHLAPWFLEKHQVTAEDFKIRYDTVMNPQIQEPGAVALRTFLQDIEEFEVIDPLTFVLRWKTEEVDGVSRVKYNARFATANLCPLASFVFTRYIDGSKILEGKDYRTSSVWAQQFTQHWAKNVIVSCGPWIFNGMQDQQIQFRRNPSFYQPLAVLVENETIVFKETIDGIWQEFKTNKIDTTYLQPTQLSEFEDFKNSLLYKQQDSAVERLDYVDRLYRYIGWNQARPLFASKRVRQALTMAIDRKRIIEQNLAGMAVEISGPFPIQSAAYSHDIEPWPYDPAAARQLLEEEGWYDSNGDGILDKVIGGERVPFSFALTYYVKSPASKSIADSIATSLKEIGIQCRLNGVDLADISTFFDDKNFDAVFYGWTQKGPPFDPRQIWHSSGAKERGSSNAIGFGNTEVDAIIDKLAFEYDQEKRIALYHRFNEILHEEQPYTFLFSSKIALLYRDYVQNVFIPADRQDLIPGADVDQPQYNIFLLNP